MNNWLGLLLFMAFSVSGWLIFDKLKVQAASVLGGMAFIVIANLLTLKLYLPSWLQFVTSINVGISIGSKMNIRIDAKMVKTVLLFAFTVIGGSLLIGFVMRALGIDTQTAMFSSLLGGLTEIAYIAREFQFNAFQVSIFQTVRMCVLLITVPVIARRLPESAPTKVLPEETERISEGRPPKANKPDKRDWIIIILGSAAAGFILSSLQVPAGKLIGASAFTAVYSAFRNLKPKLNPRWHNTMLAFVGGSVGINVTLTSLVRIPGLIVPIIVSLLLIFMIMYLSYLLLVKVGGLDKRSALFSSTLGGLTPSIAMAEAMGADSSTVSTYQVIRYFSVIALALVLGNVI
jgi:membrane AbrB-like protein